MLELRSRTSLGSADHGWLKTYHHFSFADYYDPARMHWGVLRVWNDDLIAPQSGFPMHPHQNMEIITYVYQGAISHRDSLGHSGRTSAGQIQVMSAGSGIVHAEYNLEEQDTRLFQIWLMPREKNAQPSWCNLDLAQTAPGQARVLASGFSEDQSASVLALKSPARLVTLKLNAGQKAHYRLADGHKGYLVASVGALRINQCRVEAGDGLAISHEERLDFSALKDCELVLIDCL